MSLIASDQFRIVVGLGKSGMSLVRFLARQGLPFAVVDTRANPPELATWIITERVSITNTPPMMNSTTSWRTITAMVPSAAPSASAPTSPMKT